MLRLRTDRRWPGGQKREPLPTWLKVRVLENYQHRCALCGFNFAQVEEILRWAKHWWNKLGENPRDFEDLHARSIRARLVDSGRLRKTLYEFDHVTPIALDGKTDAAYLRPLCYKPCHAEITASQVKPRVKQVRLRSEHERALARQRGVI